MAKGESEGLKKSAPLELEEVQGKGIKALFDMGQVVLGSRTFLEAEGIDCSQAPKEKGTEVLVAIDSKLEGYLQIADTIKEDGIETIKALKNMGMFTAMLTGDKKETAQHVATIVGVDGVYGELLPEEKLLHLQNIRREKGRVLYVGDGINDAPVLANADVGAAMGSGADAAMEVADVVFMNPKVSKILESIRIGRRTHQIVIQNVVFALGIKLLVMLLGFFGFANMWLAIFADTGVAMLCVLNATRAMKLRIGK